MRAPLTLAALLFAFPVAAATPQEKQSCISASERAQQLRSDAKLLASREQLLSCARDVCPSVIRKDCARWLAEVDEALPTIVLGAKDNDGHDVSDVKVTVDDKPFADHLDGKAVSVDPGSHIFKFERNGEDPISETVLVREGEKNRIVAIAFRHAKSEKGDPPPVVKTVSPAAWIFGGVGVVALGSFAYFGLLARSTANDLRATCAPACPEDDVSRVRSKLLVADVSLAVSLLSFGAAMYFFLNPTETRAVAFMPLPGGAALQIAGRF